MSDSLNKFIYKGYKYEIIILTLKLIFTKKDIKLLIPLLNKNYIGVSYCILHNINVYLCRVWRCNTKFGEVTNKLDVLRPNYEF